MSWRNQPRDRRGRWTTSWLGIGAALAVGIGVAAGGSAIGGGTAGSGTSVSSGTGGSGSSASRPGGRSGSDARTVRARDRNQDTVALRLAGAGRDVRRIDGAVGTDCAAISYGRTRSYFAANPCVAVGRALFEVRERGARVYVAVAVVDMPTDDDGIVYKRLVDTYGTGNVRELRTPRGVRWTGRSYRSVREESTVVNAQAEPAGGTAAGTRLAEAVVRDATSR